MSKSKSSRKAASARSKVKTSTELVNAVARGERVRKSNTPPVGYSADRHWLTRDGKRELAKYRKEKTWDWGGEDRIEVQVIAREDGGDASFPATFRLSAPAGSIERVCEEVEKAVAAVAKPRTPEATATPPEAPPAIDARAQRFGVGGLQVIRREIQPEKTPAPIRESCEAPSAEYRLALDCDPAGMGQSLRIPLVAQLLRFASFDAVLGFAARLNELVAELAAEVPASFAGLNPARAIAVEGRVKLAEQAEAIALSRDVHMPARVDHCELRLTIPDGGDVHANVWDATDETAWAVAMSGPRGLIEALAGEIEALVCRARDTHGERLVEAHRKPTRVAADPVELEELAVQC